MSEFKREDRYIVLKLSKMSDFQKDMIYPVIEAHGIPQVDCVVVEDDWPEYEAVWRMIERRVTGSPAPSRLEMKHVMQALDQVRGGPVLTSNQCHDLAMLLNDYLPIEDAAQSELAALREELDELAELKAYATIPLRNRCAERKDLQQRLTAAEQRNAALMALLQRVVDSSVLSFEADAPEDLESLEVDICAVLAKPTESGASE